MLAMTQSAPNGQANSIVPRSQGQVALPTLLGRQTPRIPVAGRIRAGIKVLTKKAETNARAREIYDKGVEAGKGFETIERDIAAALPDLANPLVPRNVPYFTVRGEDFPNPLVARQILEKFGEDRGEGLKLYRFPVIFPADAWQSVMPHELVAWCASQKLFWSEYSEDGRTRYCKTYEPVPVDAQGRRALRIFGGRKITLRSDNEGRCEPESCPEYQSRRCNLSGRFIFYIPGIQSLSAFELGTNSFYALRSAIEKFQTIGFMRGGRISGFLDGKRTPFFITKRLVEVSRIDDAGKPTRVSQWLIELEAPIDVGALLQREDGLETLEARARDAVVALEGEAHKSGGFAEGRSEAPVVVEETGEIVVEPEGPNASSAVEPPKTDERDISVRRAKAQPTERAAATRSAASARTGDASAAAEKTLTWILDAAAALGVPADRFEQYAQKRWGKGWRLAEGGRKRALDEVSAFADDATGFEAKVAGELGF